MTAVIKGLIKKSKAKKRSSAKVVDNSTVKKREKYSIETTFTGKQISISRGKVTIKVDITDRVLFMYGRDGKEFIFKNGNSPGVVKLWEEVIGCLSVAIQEIKKQRKL